MTIDFTSTRNDIDIQSQRCAKLVASVIAQALIDLMIRPNSQERLNKINLNTNAVRSVHFFKSKQFLSFSAMVGFSGEEFLDRITKGGTTIEFNGEEWVTRSRVIPKNYISEMNLRTIRARMRWRCSLDIPLQPTTEEDLADEAAWDLHDQQLKEKSEREERKRDEQRKNSVGKIGKYSLDIDRAHRVYEARRSEVAEKISTTKRRNESVS